MLRDPGRAVRRCHQLYIDPDLIELLDLGAGRCTFAIESDLVLQERAWSFALISACGAGLAATRSVIQRSERQAVARLRRRPYRRAPLTVRIELDAGRRAPRRAPARVQPLA